ncbi:N-6 DNA methylase [Candidatus Harpocratesius sp.]
MSDQCSISAEELKNQFGSESTFFHLYSQIFIENINSQEFKSSYRYWTKEFGNLSAHLNSEEMKLEFYLRISYFIWISQQIIHEIDSTFDFDQNLPFSFASFQFNFNYPIQSLENKQFFAKKPLNNKLPNNMFVIKKFADEDLFSPLLTDLLSLDTLEEKGMFFTPNSIARFLVYQLNRFDGFTLENAIIDPTCGSGAILRVIVRQILDLNIPFSKFLHYFSNIFGIDENPAALLSTILNLWIMITKHYNHQYNFKQLYSYFKKNYFCLDLLDISDNKLFSERIFHIFHIVPTGTSFQSSKIQKNKHKPNTRYFFTAIGNLPWNVLNNIRTPALKDKILSLAKYYQIGMTWKNQSNIEIATIFFEIIRRTLVKAGGIMAFLLPASLLTGSQHAKFRRFLGISEILSFQLFPDFFPIHSMLLICRTKYDNTSELDSNLKYVPLPIKSSKVTFLEKQNTETKHPSLNWIEEFLGISYPATFKIYRNQPLVGKYIVKSQYHSKISISPSDYTKLVYRGFDITPRKLLFIDCNRKHIKDPKKEVIQIFPIKSGYSSTQSTRWNNVTFTPTKIERDFIFQLIKSTDLIPFKIISQHFAFLPIKLEKKRYHVLSENQLPPLAKEHFKRLKIIYQNNRNQKARNTSLIQSISYGNKLFNPHLTQNIKVIYPVGGSRCKAAIIRDSKLLIDVTFYYLTPKCENEAYYLLAWLNSNFLQENLHRVCSIGANGSIRVIHLAPWQFPLPEYKNANDYNKIAEIGKKMETRVFQIYHENKIDIDLTKSTNLSNNHINHRYSLSKIYKLLNQDDLYQQYQIQLSKALQHLFTTYENRTLSVSPKDQNG